MERAAVTLVLGSCWGSELQDSAVAQRFPCVQLNILYILLISWSMTYILSYVIVKYITILHITDHMCRCTVTQCLKKPLLLLLVQLVPLLLLLLLLTVPFRLRHSGSSASISLYSLPPLQLVQLLLLKIILTFTFKHLVDPFIQGDLQSIKLHRGKKEDTI